MGKVLPFNLSFQVTLILAPIMKKKKFWAEELFSF